MEKIQTDNAKKEIPKKKVKKNSKLKALKATTLGALDTSLTAKQQLYKDREIKSIKKSQSYKMGQNSSIFNLALVAKKYNINTEDEKVMIITEEEQPAVPEEVN